MLITVVYFQIPYCKRIRINIQRGQAFIVSLEPKKQVKCEPGSNVGTDEVDSTKNENGTDNNKDNEDLKSCNLNENASRVGKEKSENEENEKKKIDEEVDKSKENNMCQQYCTTVSLNVSFVS